ncbi:hypothetical protein AB0J28_00480 [Streptosporangium canum]|uniref:hypothetical protein n=1 Tax=Streptosporangium canum TaxID=324952 RepID=UPI003443C9DC
MTTTIMRPDMARALALLTAGHTIRDAATHMDWPISSVRGLIKGQRGWLVDNNDRVYDPSQPGHKVRLPEGVKLADLNWAKQLKTSAPTPVPIPRAPGSRPGLRSPEQASAMPTEPAPTTAPTEPGTVDQLLARAAQVDDRKVQTALRNTQTAITMLRERLTTVEKRAAEEAAKDKDRAAALREIADLETALAAAKSRAKQLGAKPGKATLPPAEPSAEASRDPAKWEPGREPTATPARRYSPGVDYQPAEVRTWAKTEGYAFPRNGRFLPGPLVQEWLDAQGSAS